MVDHITIPMVDLADTYFTSLENMSKYFRLRFSGENIGLEIEAKCELHGFYINIDVHSNEKTSAIEKGKEDVLNMLKSKRDISFKTIENLQLVLDEISEISYHDYSRNPQGFVWYPM